MWLCDDFERGCVVERIFLCYMLQLRFCGGEEVITKEGLNSFILSCLRDSNFFCKGCFKWRDGTDYWKDKRCRWCRDV